MSMSKHDLFCVLWMQARWYNGDNQATVVRLWPLGTLCAEIWNVSKALNSVRGTGVSHCWLFGAEPLNTYPDTEGVHKKERPGILSTYVTSISPRRPLCGSFFWWGPRGVNSPSSSRRSQTAESWIVHGAKNGVRAGKPCK